jgi:AraC-like DNA-binding protein
VNLFIGKKTKKFNPLFALTLFIILLDLYFWWEFSQFSLKEKMSYLTGLTTYNYPWQMNTINGLFVLAEFIYFTAALINVFRFSKIAREFYSEEEEIKLRYIKKFIILIFSLNFFLIVVYAALPTPNVEYIFLPLFLNVIYLYILYNAFKHSALFTYKEFQLFEKKIAPVALVGANIADPNKISKSNYHLKQELGDLLSVRVSDHLTKDKPYLNPNYHIEDLARELKIQKHHLSFVINSRFKKSFFELVNSYRIDEAKEKLKGESGCHSVDAVGYDVGFNTKSAFYRAFKKYTNLTPAQFCKKIKSDKPLK